MIAETQDEEFRALTQKISAERGFRCASYKDKCLRRRIAVRMRARGSLSYGEYAQVLDRDSGEYDRLIDTLTINVTKFFRNPEVWAALATAVVPRLWSGERPEIRVWSAGCSSGEEAYSIAALFHRHAATTGMLGQIERVHILGTDIDRTSLDAATEGRYEESDFADTPPDLRRRYFAASAPFTPSAGIRSLVRFERRDIIGDPPPAGEHHLILCRNVMIYFDRETQERLFEVFYSALAPGGILVLGKVETLLGPSRQRFMPIDARERLFCRP